MISATTFLTIVERLGEQGRKDIAWAEGIKPPTDARDFADEIIFVICNSGMKNTVARGIYERVIKALVGGQSAHEVFGHAGKAEAIDQIWKGRVQLFAEYRSAADKLAFIKELPWVGPITKWHVAKNFGLDCVKPDVHLTRLAAAHKTTPDLLCGALSRLTGYRIATIDTVLWRASADGILNSRTGALT